MGKPKATFCEARKQAWLRYAASVARYGHTATAAEECAFISAWNAGADYIRRVRREKKKART